MSINMHSQGDSEQDAAAPRNRRISGLQKKKRYQTTLANCYDVSRSKLIDFLPFQSGALPSPILRRSTNFGLRGTPITSAPCTPGDILGHSFSLSELPAANPLPNFPSPF